MSTLLIILTVVFLLSLACGAVMWLFLRSRRAAGPDHPTVETVAEAPAFRWRYIALPLVVLILTVAMVGYFYRLLPPEVAYHFQSDGSPDQWLSRSTIVLWALLPQFFLTILAGAITWGLTKLGSVSSDVAAIMAKLGRLLLVMGNMVAIPQVILLCNAGYCQLQFLPGTHSASMGVRPDCDGSWGYRPDGILLPDRPADLGDSPVALPR